MKHLVKRYNYNYSVVDVLKVAYWSDRLIKDLLAFVALLAFGRLCSGDVYDVCIWTSFYHWFWSL